MPYPFEKALSVEVDLPDPEPVRGPAVGIDVGLTHFATFFQDDGSLERIAAPKPLGRYLRMLSRRQREHSRKVR